MVYTYILELKVLYFYPSSVLVTTSLSLHIHMDTHCFSGVSTEMNIVVSKKGWVLILDVAEWTSVVGNSVFLAFSEFCFHATYYYIICSTSCTP